jgi:microcystin-dependent protein
MVRNKILAGFSQGLGLAIGLGVGVATAALVVPHEFQPGTSISSAQINANFAAIEDFMNRAESRLVPVGTIVPFAGPIPPHGWLLCDGATLDRAEFASLFAAIGVTYGSDDASTFNLPDLRGIFPKGAGQQGRATWGGSGYAATLGEYRQDRAQGHTHRLGSGKEQLNTLDGGDVLTGGIYQSGTSPLWYSRLGSLQLVADATNGAPRVGPTTEPASLAVNFIILASE